MKGFTLVEVLVVIGLLLVLSLVVYTTFYSTSSMTILNGAAEQVASDLRLTRDLAVSESTRYRVRLSAGSGTYSLQKRDALTGTWTDAPGTEQPNPLPSGVQVQSVADLDGGTLIYNSIGAPFEGTGTGTPLVGSGADGMDHIILISNKSGKTVSVGVTPGSGLVEVLP